MTDSIRRRRPGSPPSIVVLLVDDQPFVGAALRNAACLRAATSTCTAASAPADAIAPADRLDPALVSRRSRHAGDRRPDAGARRSAPIRRPPPRRWSCCRRTTIRRSRPARSPRARTGFLVKLPPKAELVACIRDHASRSAGGKPTLDLAVIDGFHEAARPDFTRR
jgi:DNA-binding NarL/FixJ family response regulator